MRFHIEIVYYFPQIGTVYRYGYKVGRIKRDSHGAGFLTLDYRNRKLDRPVESLSPTVIENIVEMFCAGLDGLNGALTANTWEKAS